LHEDPKELFLSRRKASSLGKIKVNERPQLVNHQNVNKEDDKLDYLVDCTQGTFLYLFICLNKVEPVVYFDENYANSVYYYNTVHNNLSYSIFLLFYLWRLTF
jgi:hypothetical protein